MKSATNYVIVEVSQETDDQIVLGTSEKDGKEIILHQYYNKKAGDTFKNRRTYGTVIAAPDKLFMPALRQVYDGSPAPIKHRGYDVLKALEYKIVNNPNIAVEQEEIRKMYRCEASEYEFEFQKEVEVKEGDKVYFHYFSICDNNWMGYHHGIKLYKVMYDMIYCIIREGKLIPCNKNVFIEPYYDESYQEIDLGHFKTRAKTNETGLVTSVKDEPEVQKGWLNGERVIFRPKRDNIRKIEGKEYYVMKEWDVLANFNPLRPIGPYVVMIPERKYSLKHISLPTPEFTNRGEVEHGKYAGSKVIYNHKSKEGVFMKEYNRMLVHQEDIMAIIE